ncbi:MAG: hypothetical protein ACYSVY_08150, partial [Planctomycetota bacterium]
MAPLLGFSGRSHARTRRVRLCKLYDPEQSGDVEKLPGSERPAVPRVVKLRHPAMPHSASTH